MKRRRRSRKFRTVTLAMSGSDARACVRANACTSIRANVRTSGHWRNQSARAADSQANLRRACM
eukprot:10011283-Lingulodinium_polyedra.AAC.1